MQRSPTCALLLVNGLCAGLAAVACGVLIAPALHAADERPGVSIPGWGRVVDPDGDCQVRLEADRLVFDVPGVEHNLTAETGKLNAPRVVRSIEGDFIIEVQVLGAVRPGAVSTTEDSVPYHGAGLVVWQDEKNYVRLERAAVFNEDRIVSYANFELREDGIRAGSQPDEIDQQPLYLRLERRGEAVYASHSRDGRSWVALPELPVKLTRSVQVGVLAVSSSTKPLHVRFDHFRVFRDDNGPKGP